jgi:hypothetical protein
VCVINGLDSADGADTFMSTALDIGINVIDRAEFAANVGIDSAEAAIATIRSATCRVIFMVASASDAGVILRSAINAGVMGATSGYLWVLSDAITSNLDLVQEEAGQSATTAGDLLMVQGVDDIHPYMKGSIGCLPISPVGSKVEAFKERYTSRQSTLPSGTCENDASVNGDCTCAAGVDDAGAPLFQFDHDSSDGTPDRCVGFDYAQDEPNEYTYYAYDAVYAFARAAQKMIDDDQTDFNGPALQEALKQMGAFEGVTGAVEFENNGDRETGIKFDIVNHDGNEFLSVGSWTAGGTVVWADEAAGKDSIVWSTLDGSQVIDEVIDAGGLKDSMSAATILTMLVVGAIIVFLVVLFFKSQIARKDKEVAELKHDLAMVQQYSDKEQKMIQDMINTFRHEHADHKKAQQDPNKSYDAAAAEKDLERLLINSSEIECQDVVGKGSFGEVFKAKYRGSTVAVKTMKEVSEASLKRFKEEVLLSGDLSHSNIVTMVGACWETGLMALVMEYCSKGMSSEVLESEGHLFNWDDPLLKWCLDVAKAVKYLHAVTYFDVRTGTQVDGIIHRDLKPDNCLYVRCARAKRAQWEASGRGAPRRAKRALKEASDNGAPQTFVFGAKRAQ